MLDQGADRTTRTQRAIKIGASMTEPAEQRVAAPERSRYWEFDVNGNLPRPSLRECPLCPNGGKPYFTRTVNGTNMIYVGCSQCGLELKAALLMVTPAEEQPSKDIVAI